MNRDYAEVLRHLQRAQMSEYGINRATGIPFSPLRILLGVMMADKVIEKDGVRYKIPTKTPAMTHGGSPRRLVG